MLVFHPTDSCNSNITEKYEGNKMPTKESIIMADAISKFLVICATLRNMLSSLKNFLIN